MTDWKDYRSNGARGRLLVLEKLHSPQLGNERDVLVYLPASHAADDRCYPVVYMHDGQNLFDPETSFAGAWEVDQAVEAAAEEGNEAIIVGLPNMGPQRIEEYSPFRDAKVGGGKGDRYLDFIVETVKPIIDRDFPVRRDRAGTGIAGSSLGGLISLYALFRRPAVFGFAGIMSPALWLADRAIFGYLESAPFAGGRLYIDVGVREGPKVLADVKRLRELLERKGYNAGEDLLYIIDQAGEHNEAAWARRLRREIEFLLGGRARRRERDPAA